MKKSNRIFKQKIIIMKAIFFKSYFLMGMLILPLVFGCSKESNSLLKEFSYSDCKNNQKSLNVNQSSDDKELIKITSENGLLKIKHINVYFNCEPGKIFATATVHDTVVTITEAEQKHYADCICPYDLSMKVGPLNFQHYYFVITRGDAEYTHFSLDYHADIDTTFEVIKNK